MGSALVASGKTPATPFAGFIEKVEKQTGYCVAYAMKDINLTSTAFPEITGLSAQEAIWKVLDKEDYNLIISGKHLIIKKKLKKEETYDDPPGIDPDFMVEKIPPPQESVFSGETKLIIIRRDSTATTILRGASPIPQDSTQTKTAGRENKIKEIPFRSDLLNGEAYEKTVEAGTKKDKKEKKQD